MRFKYDKGGPYPLVVKLDKGKHKWCACGMTKKVPFCDGTCKGAKPVRFELKKKGKVELCNCGLTKNPPYCDGSHKKLKKK
jgi:CDGSH iron-sulfur domain-containing protein 3